MSKIEIIPVGRDKIGFINWAENLWVSSKDNNRIEPIRRVLSLMRLEKAETMIFESVSWDKKGCSENGICFSCYQGSSSSCCEYIDNLLANYDYINVNKTCYRMSFFRNTFTDGDDFSFNTLNDSSFLGYCVVHKDELVKSETLAKTRCYITECMLKLHHHRDEMFDIGTHQVSVRIFNKSLNFDNKFSITGSYFSQQNGITNCCSNAAIKMAFRSIKTDICAEEINKSVCIDHNQRKGYQGIYPDEFSGIIKDTIGWDSHLLNSREMHLLKFMKVIYHALESRFPVILTIEFDEKQASPEESENKNQSSSTIGAHAITFIGHTMNAHNWWSYALGLYFSDNFNEKEKETRYLPSFLWCDNFVVQDDNMGPYYYLPVRMLFTIPSFKATYKAYKNIRKKISFLSALILNGKRILGAYLKGHQQKAIISYPKQFSFFKDTADSAEIAALEGLRFLFEKVLTYKDNKSIIDSLKEEDYFQNYFYKYYKSGQLILRSFVTDKEKYIQSLDFSKKDIAGIKAALKIILPNYFWVVEISIPELFWINKEKVGVLIIDPEKLKAASTKSSRKKDKYLYFSFGYVPGFAFINDKIMDTPEQNHPFTFFDLDTENITTGLMSL